MAAHAMAHRFTAEWEGGISDHPADAGGYTAYGVATSFLRDLAKSEKGKKFLEDIGLGGRVDRQLMRKITPGLAARIFRWYFWDPFNLDECGQAVATVYYDMLVNHGRGGGTKLVQRGVNRASGPGTLAVDGLYGPKTRQALKLADRRTALEAIAARVEYYKAIAAAKPSQKVFLKGWLNRAGALREHIVKMG